MDENRPAMDLPAEGAAQPALVQPQETELDRAAAAMGLTDPVTGAAVLDQRGLDRWLDRQEELSARGEQSRRDRAEERRAAVDRQLAEIGKLDPSVRSLEDLTSGAYYDALYALVKKGNTLVDAYKLANFDALTRRAAESARQRLMNELEGKRHLSATEQRGEGGISVPRDVLEQYRLLNPEATDAEIRRHYNRMHKKT